MNNCTQRELSTEINRCSERSSIFHNSSSESGNTTHDGSKGSGGSRRDNGMKPQLKKDVGLDNDPKVTTRIDFGDYFPEGGWGWVVTGACTLVYILCNGFHFAFGTLYICILEDKTGFTANEDEAAWLGSVGISITLFLSPIISTICQRKSARIYAVIGGLICAFILGFFKSNGAAVLFRELYWKLEWRYALQCIAGLLVLTILAGSLYRSASMYHPRRKVIMHIKSQKKNRHEGEDDSPPYFDFSALHMRGLQALMVISGIVGLGIYVPFVAIIKTGKDLKLEKDRLLLLNIYLGLGFLIGVYAQGYIIIRDSKQCSICRRHLCQSCCIACGVLTFLLLLAKDFNSLALYAWGFGIFCGGYFYTLKMYAYELVKYKLMERAWGFICAAHFIPVLIGSPISLYLNQVHGELHNLQAGYIFAGSAMVLGGLLFFFMPPLEKHKSNQEVIQISKQLCSKNTAEATALLDLDLSDAMVTKPVNNVQFIVSPSRLKHKGKDGGKIQMQCFIHHREREKPKQIILSKITEEKEGLRLDFNEVSQVSLISKNNDSTLPTRLIKPEKEHSVSCGHATDCPSDSTNSHHTGKFSSDGCSSKSFEGRKFKKSTDNVKVELFDPPSQEKESTATISYDSDLYINLCEAQV
ncbi:unnamed protein product [Mytilus edulis]|uniref:Uncharacterized protein n=1 Tax=Mytilus edulis TaxID=6550 RepID=A0A8S3R7Y9_MYTED|nr:unnamed protein product [Mytilus edulis]